MLVTCPQSRFSAPHGWETLVNWGPQSPFLANYNLGVSIVLLWF